jgi:hypothetical protein
MSATVAYLEARAVVGRPASDREAHLLEALEGALLARIEAEEERDGALDRCVELDRKVKVAEEVAEELELVRDELRDAEKSLAEETKRADDAEDALRRALKDEEGTAIIDAIASLRDLQGRLTTAKETIAKLEAENIELRKSKHKGSKRI